MFKALLGFNQAADTHTIIPSETRGSAIDGGHSRTAARRQG